MAWMGVNMSFVDYFAHFESVQLLGVFGLGAVIITALVLRHNKKMNQLEHTYVVEERRFKLLESEKRPRMVE